MGRPHGKNSHVQDQELITNYDLVGSAHAMLGGITLDVASSKLANEHVDAEEFYTPIDDGLNVQDFHGRVYLFPPSGAYYWDKKNERWKKTDVSHPTLISSHAIWFQKLFKAWFKGHVTEAIFFSNNMDMFRYEQIIFDLPICILRTAPTLLKNSTNGVTNHKTGSSFVVYFPSAKNPEKSIDDFRNLYAEKGRVIY